MRAPIGRMRRRLTIQQPVDADDDAGGSVRSYAELATVFAAVEPVSSRRETDAGEDRAIATHRIVIRYRTDVTAQHRLVLGTRVFRILGIVDVAAEHRFLDILAEELGP